MNMNIVEGLDSPSAAPMSSSPMAAPTAPTTMTIIPVGAFTPYPSVPLYQIYNRSANPLIMLFDPTTGNMLVTDNMTPTTNFVMVDRNGETNEYSSASVITPTAQNLDPSVKIGWTYENQQVSVCNITVNSHTYLYVFDQSVSPPTIAIYKSIASNVTQELPTTPLTSQSIQNLNVNDSSVQSLETAIGNMSNTDLRVRVGSSSVSSTSKYYVIVSIPQNSSNKTVVIINKTDYTLVSVNRMMPGSGSGSGTGMGSGSESGSSVMPSNLGSLDTLIFALADIAGTYGKNMRGQGQDHSQGPSPLSGNQYLSSFEKNNTGLGCGINPADSNYILKSEIVPPVCPQCPSCGTSGCSLSVNSTGQIVDCNGNVISNFGSTPSSGNAPSSGYSPSSGYAPSTIAGSISGSINNAVSTTGDVADTALTSASGAVSNVADAAGNTASNLVDSAGNTASSLGKSAGSAVTNVAGSAEKGVTNVAGTAGSTVGGLGKDLTNIVGGIGQDVTTLGTSAIGATSGVANNAINSATSLVGGLGATAPGTATATSTATPYGYPPYGYGYPPYGGAAQQPYGNYPYMGYGGYQGPSTCSQQSTYLPITNDFSAFGR